MTEPVSNPRARVCECGAVLRVAEIRATPMGVIVIYHRCTCGGVREWVRRFVEW